MTQLIGKTLLLSRGGKTFTITPTATGYLVRKLVGRDTVRIGVYDTLEAAREACK